jgi:hypothetical protein
MADAVGLVLGTHLYPASGDAERRQQRAVAALRTLRGVDLVNLQFSRTDRRLAPEGLVTLDALAQDSTTIAGEAGVRKPVVSELFDRLAAYAESRGRRYFAFLNSDIVVTQAAVDAVAASGRDAVVFSRMDVERGSGRELGINVYGTDMFAVDAAWWRRHRAIFRPYVVGEGCWDNVYTAQLLCRGNAVLLNRGALILHEQHDAVWVDSPFAAHNGFLAALDSLYFTIWAVYVDALLGARASGAGETEELALQARIFRWPPSSLARLKHVGREIKARARYRMRRWRRRPADSARPV